MKNFDFQALSAQIQKLFSPQSVNDTNKFLEEMPLRAGYGVLIAGGIAWFIGGLAIVYATTIARDVAEIRAELVKSEALKPVVATLQRRPVSDKDIEAFVKRVDPLYKNVTIESARGGKVFFSSSNGRYFGQFREAINHAYNGGQRWRLSLESLCVGRECEDGFLKGVFTVNTLDIQR